MKTLSLGLESRTANRAKNKINGYQVYRKIGVTETAILKNGDAHRDIVRYGMAILEEVKILPYKHQNAKRLMFRILPDPSL